MSLRLTRLADEAIGEGHLGELSQLRSMLQVFQRPRGRRRDSEQQKGANDGLIPCAMRRLTSRHACQANL